MKVLGMVTAVAIAFAPLSLVLTAPGVAQAAPCAGAGSNPKSCQFCLYLVGQYHSSSTRPCYEAPPPRPAQAPPSRAPEVPPLPDLPTYAPPTTVQTPQVVPPSPPATVPVKINPPAAGAPGNAPAVAPPKGLDPPSPAVAAAKAAPATQINPASPPEPPMQVYDFNQQVQNVVNTHSANIDLVKADNQTLVRPRHWDYIDYDEYHRPTLYNPLDEAMTFRYFYDGAYRQAFVPAGGRIVLDAATAGLFPFTTVGYSHVASGSFYGGASIPPPGANGPPPDYTASTRPEVYRNVLAAVPADDQVVQVGQVQVVAHDESQPMGSRDTFLLDDSTLAWGQVNDPRTSAQIRVTKTQPMPGVGPTDNGSFLVALAAHQGPTQQPNQPWWPMLLRYGVLGLVVGLVAWAVERGRRNADETADSQV